MDLLFALAYGTGFVVPGGMVPHSQRSGNGRCATDLDCSLNGLCSSAHTCVCNKPWSGSACATALFKPVTFPQGYGMAPNLTAWGGGAFYDAATSMYHAYIHTMNNHCPLRNFQTNSRIDHVVAASITGPYSFRDVAVGVNAANSVPKRLPDGSYAIFHTGDGNKGPNAGPNCSTPSAFSNTTTDTTISFAAPRTKGSQQIHVSQHLDGPWTALSPNTLPACGNPAPHIHANGTFFIVCQHHLLYRSSTIHGPWSLVVDLQSIIDGQGGSVLGKYEDPFMYQDSPKNGANWHIVYHVYNTSEGTQGGKDACINTTVSGHLYSRDGVAWHASGTPPWGPRIALVGGKAVTVSTRERPYVYFNDAGEMTHLFNAVCGNNGDDCAAHTGTGCVDCKYEQWDYNLVAPFDLD